MISKFNFKQKILEESMTSFGGYIGGFWGASTLDVMGVDWGVCRGVGVMRAHEMGGSSGTMFTLNYPLSYLLTHSVIKSLI